MARSSTIAKKGVATRSSPRKAKSSATTASTKKSNGKKPKVAKKDKQGKKASRGVVESSGSEAEQAVGEDEVEIVDTTVEWGDGLTEALVAAIIENKDIKQGLFPAPGGNVSTAKGGGKKKTVWQWQLAVILFSNHPVYSKAFAPALDASPTARGTTAMRNIWIDKIKNKLKRMVTAVREGIKEMGQTGAGITAEEQIDMTMKNDFTDAWAKVKKATGSWFFDMRELIAERPNLVPVGIGHSGSEIDMSVLQDGAIDEVDQVDQASDADGTLSNNAGTAVGSPDWNMEDISGDDVVDEGPGGGGAEDDKKPDNQVKTETKKRKTTDISENEAQLKTPARPGTSTPASSRPARTTKKSRIKEFSEAAIAEETTRQKELDLDRARLEVNAKVKIEASKSTISAQVELAQQKLKAKSEKRQIKKELALEKMRMDQEYRMQQLQLNTHVPGSTQQTFTPHVMPAAMANTAGPSNLTSGFGVAVSAFQPENTGNAIASTSQLMLPDDTVGGYQDNHTMGGQGHYANF